MCRKVLGLIGVAALLAALASPAMAQEEKKDYVWKTNGKWYFRTEEVVKPFVMPATATIEVPAAEAKEGENYGFRTIGKRTEKVFFREVPRTETVHKGHDCTWKMTYNQKYTSQLHYCLVNGAEQPCPGMTAAGECLGKK